MSGPNPYSASRPVSTYASGRGGAQGLGDLLERILDKGLVIAGDVQVNLLDIELLTIKIRLLVASADTAQQMGIDWWRHDPFLTAGGRELADENAALRERVDRLEALLAGDDGTVDRTTGDAADRGEVPRAGDG